MSVLPFLLPPAPANWDKDVDHKIHAKRLQKSGKATVEPVGAEFLHIVRRMTLGRSLEEDMLLEEALNAAGDDDINLDEDEPETKKLLALDPQNWKEHDLYAVLGISKLRYKATEEDIKRAYRRKVLKHHPDKKAAASGNTSDDSFFKCIQKAWEILSDKEKKRQWDSIDPFYDDVVPKTYKPFDGNFYEIFGPLFEQEQRFSKRESMPVLGDDSSSREEVEAFYDAWFNFESWRSFEMMDEEEGGANDSREEKRYRDRNNKAARAKLKKDDISRVSKFVELAFKSDPRIVRIKEAEKAAKEAKKREKEEAALAVQREAERKAEEERLAKEREEKEEKERREAEKKEKEANKKMLRKARKAVKDLFKDHNNLLSENASLKDVEERMELLDKLMENSELWHLEEFKFRLDEQVPHGIEALSKCFTDELSFMNDRLAKAVADAETSKAAANSKADAAAAAAAARKVKAPWTPRELMMLTKAIKQFPGGTVSRWEKIADYVNHHRTEDGAAPDESALRGPEECIKKSKEQTTTTSERAAMQQFSAAAAKKKEVEITDAPTSRDVANVDIVVGVPAPAGGAKKGKENVTNGVASAKSTAPSTPVGKKAGLNGSESSTPGGFVVPEDSSWSAAQQAELEAALRKFPASQFTAQPSERWEKIANEVTGKTKKEVKQRVKDLAEAIKKKPSKK